MSKARRNLATLPPLTPAVTLPVSKPDEADALRREIKRLKSQNQFERRRHASVELLTLRLVNQLEQQVSDLRGLYIRSIALKPTPNMEKK
jgi:hypothetical protein